MAEEGSVIYTPNALKLLETSTLNRYKHDPTKGGAYDQKNIAHNGSC